MSMYDSGQAGVEREFSINSEVMEVNMENSVIVLCTIYDYIQQCGGVLNVSLDQDIRNSAQNASLAYCAECKKQAEMDKEEKEKLNKEVNDQVYAAQTQRKHILEDSVQLKNSMDFAEKERNILHVTKANSFKRTIKKKEQEADE